MCAVTRARDFMYIRCDRKVRGSFLVNCLFERITRFTMNRIHRNFENIQRKRFYARSKFEIVFFSWLLMNYSVHYCIFVRYALSHSFQLASSRVFLFLCFRNSLSLAQIIHLFLKGREIKIEWGKSQIEMINTMTR